MGIGGGDLARAVSRRHASFGLDAVIGPELKTVKTATRAASRRLPTSAGATRFGRLRRVSRPQRGTASQRLST
jgi:hypothetical protein